MRPYDAKPFLRSALDGGVRRTKLALGPVAHRLDSAFHAAAVVMMGIVAVSAVKWEETVKIQYALPLAVAIGLGFGAVAIRGLHARTTTPPIYLVVEIDEITDANGYEALRHTADATAVEVQSEDGRYFARTENVIALDGSAPKFFRFHCFR